MCNPTLLLTCIAALVQQILFEVTYDLQCIYHSMDNEVNHVDVKSMVVEDGCLLGCSSM
jgi:hypothetical protein